MKAIFKFIVFYPKSVLSAVLAFTLLLGYYSTKLEVDASTETLVLENDKDLAIFRDVAARYAAQNYLVVAYTPKDDIFASSTLEKIKNLSDELAKNELVSSVISILNVPLLQSGSGDISELVKNIPSLSDGNTDKNLARAEFLNSPLYTNNIISKDLKTTAIVLNLKNDDKFSRILNERNLLLNHELNGTLNKERKDRLKSVTAEFKAYRDEIRIKEHEALGRIKSTIAKFNDDDSLFLGGANMIADDMVGFVKSDLSTYGVSVVLVLIFCLLLFFMQIRYIFF